jgi:hypothetical protein
MITRYLADISRCPFSTRFFKTRRSGSETVLRPSNLSACHVLQLILPILLRLSNRSFFAVISRCFSGIVPGCFEAFGDLLASDRNRASGKNSVLDREITTRIAELPGAGLYLAGIGCLHGVSNC